MSVDVAARPLSAAAGRFASRGERLRAARRALERAEAATGPAATGPVTTGSERFLPVPDALVPFLPSGGLRRGSTTRVEGSASLLLALAAAACSDGAWCAVVGLPDLGLAAAAEIGLTLDRVVLVPRTGADAPAVLGAAIDGFDVVVVGEVPHLVDRDRRQLSSRTRNRGAVLLTTCPWPGAELVLSVTESRWTGVGEGAGSLRGRGLVVRVGGRGAVAGRREHARLWSPDGVHLVSDAPPPQAPVIAPAAAAATGSAVGLGAPGLERWAG